MADLLAFYRSGYPVRAISIRMENRNFGFADGAGAGSSDAGAGKDGPFFAKAKMSDERVLSPKETYAPLSLSHSRSRLSGWTSSNHSRGVPRVPAAASPASPAPIPWPSGFRPAWPTRSV